ncbi:lysostaphin resistance A-like protein [Methanocella sp. MCL-LM]|uniref:CPBP family intramembrane glutamic endopeptidase n=1 Tax=Methanocella sp. MCL-LM TaxID=3412035 RepID=UPI003C7124AE
MPVEKQPGRPFSLWIYLLIVFALSWPIQVAFVVWGQTELLSYSLSSLAMIMVTVGTYIAGRYVFKDSFADAGWSLGKPVHYVLVIGLGVLLWVVPTLAGLLMGSYSWPAGLLVSQVVLVFLVKFIGVLIPAFGEEFGWRGYLLPRLAQLHTPRKALLIQSVIWWAWHLPTVVGIGFMVAGTGAGAGAGVAVTVLAVVLITIVPSVMHAVIFSYIWAKSKSLGVATVYHAIYDSLREAMERTTGFAPITDLWTNVVITIIGLILLVKADWKTLLSGKSR